MLVVCGFARGGWRGCYLTHAEEGRRCCGFAVGLRSHLGGFVDIRFRMGHGGLAGGMVVSYWSMDGLRVLLTASIPLLVGGGLLTDRRSRVSRGLQLLCVGSSVLFCGVCWRRRRRPGWEVDVWEMACESECGMCGSSSGIWVWKVWRRRNVWESCL